MNIETVILNTNQIVFLLKSVVWGLNMLYIIILKANIFPHDSALTTDLNRITALLIISS